LWNAGNISVDLMLERLLLSSLLMMMMIMIVMVVVVAETGNYVFVLVDQF
jgi:hypothetical protein